MMKLKNRKDDKGYVLRTGETQRKDGRYAYSWTDNRRIRHSIYSKTLLDLRKKEKQLIADLTDGVAVYEADKVTLNQMWDKYIRSRNDLKVTTKCNYEYMYNHFVRNCLGNMVISKIKYSHVKDFYLELIDKKDLKIATLDNIHTLLHPTFSLAVRDCLIRSNPTDEILKEIKKAHPGWRNERFALTVPQQKVLVSYIDGHSMYESWYPIIITLLGTGMRIGEALGLRWEDVDFKNKVISINHSLVYRKVNGVSKFMITTPKTKKGIREIPLFDEVFEALQREYQVQKCLGFNNANIDGFSGFIFTNSKRNVYEPNAINRAIRSIVRDYNKTETEKAIKEHRESILLPSFSCHTLRHTFCTRLCEVESNLKYIQDIMGHSDIKTTLDIYADITKEKKNEILKSLCKAIIIK